MSKIITAFFGQMMNAIDKRDGVPYDDWRCSFLDSPGMILVCESTRKKSGYRFIKFFPYSGPASDQQKFTTSLSNNLSEQYGEVTITTNHSIYSFEKGLFDLSLAQQMNLILTILGPDAWETYKKGGESSYVVLP